MRFHVCACVFYRSNRLTPEWCCERVRLTAPLTQSSQREHSPPCNLSCIGSQNERDRPPAPIWVLTASCAPLCDATYYHCGSPPSGFTRAPQKRPRPHGILYTVTQSGPQSNCQSDLLLDCFQPRGGKDETTSYRQRLCFVSHQPQHGKTTIVIALNFWFHRGDWWNREGTKVGLIQLHTSQYNPNTTYRLRHGCLWATRRLMDTHPALECVGYWNSGSVKSWRGGKKVKRWCSSLIFLENTCK